MLQERMTQLMTGKPLTTNMNKWLIIIRLMDRCQMGQRDISSKTEYQPSCGQFFQFRHSDTSGSSHLVHLFQMVTPL